MILEISSEPAGSESFPERGLVSAGFWLPMGRANFFDSVDDHPRGDDWEIVLNGNSLSSLDLGGRPAKLQTSTYRRLLIVLQSRYGRAWALKPPSREGYPNRSDPDSILLACNDPQTEGFPAGVERVLLMVTHEGYFLWTAIFTESVTERRVREALTDHIKLLVGGAFYLASAKLDSPSSRDPQKAERNLLKGYRDQRQGILTFFHLNTVLEGLYSASLEPAVFFYEGTEHELSRNVERIERQYTLASFFELITGQLLVRTGQTDIDRTVLGAIDLLMLKPAGSAQGAEIARELQSIVLDETAKRDLLRQFLRITSSVTLQKLKWNIEACRRALLIEVISITHRRRPLTQAENPDEDHAITSELSEDQLRGYVMLAAAKQPIVSNVSQYLREAYEGLDASNKATIAPLFQSWTNLLNGVSSNILGLERAIEQAQQDRLLYEQEQIRAEQEALSEIERLRERHGLARTSDEIAIWASVGSAIIAAGFAAFYYFYAVVNPSGGGHACGLLESLLKSKACENGGPPGFLSTWVVIGVLFFLLGGAAFFFRIYQVTSRRRRQAYYYEFDVRVDQYLKNHTVPGFLDLHLPDTGEVRPGSSTFIPRLLPPPSHIFAMGVLKRDSYRVEQSSLDEAIHKVHVETDLRREGHSSSWFRRTGRIRVFVIYEILYHRPAEDHSYVLREVRFICTTTQELTKEELLDIKWRIRCRLIEPFIEKPILFEPLFSLHFVQDLGDGSLSLLQASSG